MIVLLVLGIVFLLYTLLQYTQHREVRWIPLLLGIVLIAGNLWGLHVADEKHLFMTRKCWLMQAMSSNVSHWLTSLFIPNIRS